MKILVLSDSHSSLSFMRRCVQGIKPDVIIHLGDYYDDAVVLQQENPHLKVHMVPGNCDRYNGMVRVPEILCYDVCGVRLYMTHGHRHNVKMTLLPLLTDARAAGAEAVLFGHTHCSVCEREEDGLWVLNPGSCGAYSGTAGLIYVEEGHIMSCQILRAADLLA